MAAPSPNQVMPKPPSEILLENLPLVAQIIKTVCRGRGMDLAQTEEFAGFVHLRLVEDDYAIVRAFQGRSAFGTFLTTVIGRLLNDYRNHEWGKWHASAEAKRLGEVAIELERMVVRDRRTPQEAFTVLHSRFPTVSKESLEDFAARIPSRQRRQFVGLENRPEQETTDNDQIEGREIATRVSSVVCGFIEGLPKEDRLLLQLRFEHDMPVPQIARSLQEDTQLLYRRLRKHFAGLREALRDAGISAADVTRLIGSDDVLLDFDLKSRDQRPSNDSEDPGAAPEEDAR
jgi:RNA polymerase sigma factor (sigma-70 family)